MAKSEVTAWGAKEASYQKHKPMLQKLLSQGGSVFTQDGEILAQYNWLREYGYVEWEVFPHEGFNSYNVNITTKGLVSLDVLRQIGYEDTSVLKRLSIFVCRRQNPRFDADCVLMDSFLRLADKGLVCVEEISTGEEKDGEWVVTRTIPHQCAVKQTFAGFLLVNEQIENPHEFALEMAEWIGE